MSRTRDIASILGATEASNTNNVALLNTNSSVGLDSSQVSAIGVTAYDSVGALPSTGLTSGDQAFVESAGAAGQSRLYISNGSGWYNVALINATPRLTLSSEGTIALATDGTATTITMTALDSDNSSDNLTLTVESGGDLFKFATVSQDSSVVTITPRSEDSANTLGFDGSATLTFKATDGISIGSVVNTFTLAFTPDWSGTPNETIVNGSNSDAYFSQGNSVITKTGTYLATPEYGQNKVHIYIRSSTNTWTSQQVITGTSINSSDTQLGRFGMGMDDNADRLAMGSPNNDEGGTNRGRAYVYSRSGTTWSLEADLVPSDPADADQFGNGLLMNSDGTYIISGSPGDDTSNTSRGAIYVFTRSGTSWSQQAKILPNITQDWAQFGQGLQGATAINSDCSYIASNVQKGYAGGEFDGAVEVWTRSGSTWSHQATIDAPGSNATRSYFGRSIAMNSTGEYLVIGAENDDRAATSDGSVHVYVRSGTSWTSQAILHSNTGAASSDNFGCTVTMNDAGTLLAAGALSFDNGSNNRSGAVFIYQRSGTSWTLKKKLEPSDASSASNGYPRYFGMRGIRMSGDGNYLFVDNGYGNVANDIGRFLIYYIG